MLPLRRAQGPSGNVATDVRRAHHRRACTEQRPEIPSAGEPPASASPGRSRSPEEPVADDRTSERRDHRHGPGAPAADDPRQCRPALHAVALRMKSSGAIQAGHQAVTRRNSCLRSRRWSAASPAAVWADRSVREGNRRLSGAPSEAADVRFAAPTPRRKDRRWSRSRFSTDRQRTPPFPRITTPTST
jgi:hypothetical protein